MDQTLCLSTLLYWLTAYSSNTYAVLVQGQESYLWLITLLCSYMLSYKKLRSGPTHPLCVHLSRMLFHQSLGYF